MMKATLTCEEWTPATKMFDKETRKMNEADIYVVELV